MQTKEPPAQGSSVSPPLLATADASAIAPAEDAGAFLFMQSKDRIRQYMNENVVKSDAAKREEEILAFWDANDIFQKSLAKPSPKGNYVVYEGPPTANGRPGIHHLESRAFKDAFPRYKTMQGYRVPRRAGWDTHGLPVELEVEKELGFKGKPDIEKYGVDAFNKKCRASVLKYIEEWSRFTKRMGYWVDQRKAYFTFDACYMESVWAIIKKISDDGRLYKDYKVLPWCARCGTALSSHELAQGYEDVKDLSVTVKFELVGKPGTYLLAWTTTPWTLPGNVALAVGSDISYVTVEEKNEDGSVVRYILAKDRIEAVFKAKELSIVEEKKGKELIGLKYVPLYDFLPTLANESEKSKFEKAYQVYAADFVTTTDGTGIVHTAVMYGADDFTLGTKLDLPKVHAVGADGKFIQGAGFLEGRFVKDEDVAVDIIKDLASREPASLLFSKEKHEHSYPFCWRCKTPLLYYARDSWYIRMQDARDTLLSENRKVHWEPAHITEGRMGEWLGNVKDWALSRERYWGTPLPVWETQDGSDRIVIGSVEELRHYIPKSGNRYFSMRHGQAENNISPTWHKDIEMNCSLTKEGIAQVERTGKSFKERIDHIFCSTLPRAKQSAEIFAQAHGFPIEHIIADERLVEWRESDTFEGKLQSTLEPYYEHEYVHSPHDEFCGGESFAGMVRRVGEFMYELESRYQGKNIFIVSHAGTGRALSFVAKGHTFSQLAIDTPLRSLENAQIEELLFVPLPHNEEYELDVHRPHIDGVVLEKDGKEYRRVREVMDVWFDSGAMPFAQDHYPFAKEPPAYPAHFISEAIDQTRGWFYTLLAIGVLMQQGAPYKNVICLGHLLDKEGKKMSKSKGNVVEPFEAMDKYGADTLRFWMYYVNQAGDSKNFDEKTVKEAARVLSWFENSAKFYDLFKDGAEAGEEQSIDRWMYSRTNETVVKVTDAMDAYRPYEATRALAGLIEDVSQWYVRRVRERVREGDTVALATLRKTLKTCALLLAPFSPFIAEWVFGMVRSDTDRDSVHLSDWPKGGEVDHALITHMAFVRDMAPRAFTIRQKLGFKVRQVLGSFSTTESYELPDDMVALLADEINVKKVILGAPTEELDDQLTPELIAEGDEREKARAVAEARKHMNLSPKDNVEVVWGVGPYSVELSTGSVAFDVKHNAT